MNRQNRHRAEGYGVLLLCLLLLHLLKSDLLRSRPHGSSPPGPIFVQVGGTVKYPAVYAFTKKPQLGALVERAGGLLSGEVLPKDLAGFTFGSGKKVTVEGQGDGLKWDVSEMSSFFKLTLGIPVSLNRASETGLTALPGIGPSLARAIIEERRRRGGFKRLHELLSVPGIGPKLYAKIVPYLTL